MKICNKLGLQRGDVLSVVGAGGKTTLIFRLARELVDSKVLIVTTTRMYFPDKSEYDYLFIDEEPISKINGVYFLSGTPDENGKATPYAGLSRVAGLFDYTLIEADGAKGKLLKGWAEYEPVVIPETTRTIGVLNLGLLGERATPDNIHRLDAYTQLTHTQPADIITMEHIRVLVSKGLFKNAIGEKILCVIGQADHDTFEGVDKWVILQ